jgi:hypothetical protein
MTIDVRRLPRDAAADNAVVHRGERPAAAKERKMALRRRFKDYALISDCMTAALVGRNGSIDWLSLPRFDSDPCFAALLGDPGYGRCLLAPVDPGAHAARRYLDGLADLRHPALMHAAITKRRGPARLALPRCRRPSRAAGSGYGIGGERRLMEWGAAWPSRFGGDRRGSAIERLTRRSFDVFGEIFDALLLAYGHGLPPVPNGNAIGRTLLDRLAAI